MPNRPLPIIGITTYHRTESGEFTLPGAYVDAIALAGGIPVLLPPHPADSTPLLTALDGLILAGGGDIDPALYGGEAHPSVYLVDAERDTFELALAKAALSANIPTLGICRGMQMLNVATGGDLVTHVPDVYGYLTLHRLDYPRRPVEHTVQVSPDSRLAQLLGTSAIAPTISVVSWHHQAVKAIAPVWTVVAQAKDGLIEAIEHQQHPWLVAVQWHPELSLDAPVHQRFFQGFVSSVIAAREHA